MRRMILATAVSLAAGSAMAQDITSFTLDNGLEAVVIEDHRAPLVVHMLWYRVGSADEPPGKSGIAHFLEHLLFKATETLESGEFSRVVAANGGTDNAFTSYDYTGYFQRVAADRLGLMMQMEADRMRNLVITEDDVVTERDVILEERSQRTDSNPGALFSEQRRAAQYQNHPYGIPVIGWRHEMEQLSRQDALDFYAEYYAPNNAILVVAGDVDPENVKALAEEHYGHLEPTPGLGPRMRPAEPPQLAERRIMFHDPRVAQPYVARGYLAPERDSGAQETAAALTILAELLGGNSATSYFGEKLQFEEQTAIYTSAYYGGTSYDDTVFSTLIVPAEGVSLEEAEAAMDQAISDFVESGIDAERIDRIKRQIRAGEIYQQDDIQNVARRYGASLTQGLTLEDIAAWPDILAAVTAEDVKAAAEMVFNRKNAVTGYYMAEDEAEATQ